jgi:hypothetical protein
VRRRATKPADRDDLHPARGAYIREDMSTSGRRFFDLITENCSAAGAVSSSFFLL